MAHWYYGENGEQRGPVDEEELRGLIGSGRVNASTIVWREGMENWTPLSGVPEWAEQMVARPEASPYVPPQDQGAPVPASYSPYPVAPNNGNAIASLICGVSSIVMMFTCLIGIIAAIPAVICGHMALRQISESAVPMAGRGMAVAGLVTGYITIAITAVFAVIMLFAVISGV